MENIGQLWHMCDIMRKFGNVFPFIFLENKKWHESCFIDYEEKNHER